MRVRLSTMLVVIALFALGLFAWVWVSRIVADIDSGLGAFYGKRKLENGKQLEFPRE
jgi:hypothetical protein